jgi:hypothetical protein
LTSFSMVCMPGSIIPPSTKPNTWQTFIIS